MLMEEMCRASEVPFSLGNIIFADSSLEESLMNVTDFKLMADSSSLFPDSTVKTTDVDSGSDVSFTMSLGSDKNRSGASEDDSSWLANDAKSEEDGLSSLEGDPILDISCSLSVVSDTSSLCGDDLLAELGPNFLDVEKSICDVELISRESSADIIIGGSVSVAENVSEETVDGAKSSTVLIQSEKAATGRIVRSIFEVDYVPLWGFTSVCGRRPEMEDSLTTIPRFMRIPLQMLIGDRVLDGVTSRVSHLTGHFFGVYDGHGGSQVNSLAHLIVDFSNYCLL